MQRLFLEREQRYETLLRGEQLFGFAQQNYPELKRMKRELLILTDVFGLYDDTVQLQSTWNATVWLKIDLQAVRTSVAGLDQRLHALSSDVFSWESVGHVQAVLDKIKPGLPIIEALSTPAFLPRHWIELSRVIGRQLSIDPRVLTVEAVLQRDIIDRFDDIMLLSKAAQQEAQLEGKVHQIAVAWGDMIIPLLSYKQRGAVTLDMVEMAHIQEQLEDAVIRLTEMRQCHKRLRFVTLSTHGRANCRPCQKPWISGGR